MLLRSSSTPILSSLISSSSSPHFSETSNNNHNHHHIEKPSSLSSWLLRKTSFSCNFSPLSDSSPNQKDPSSPLGFRRARSDGNLHSLLSSDHGANPVLDTIPSSSFYSPNEVREDEEEDAIENEEREQFGIMGRDQNLNLVDKSGDVGNGIVGNALPLFLARGLGIDRIGSGLLNVGVGGDNGNGNGGERSEIENYYRRMVDENPSNALFLSNYAQFLYQSKGDAKRAEEYYSRAILVEPGDGEILSQYAKLVWELHHDKERASSYFEQAVEAMPHNSQVLAAYANFLWEIGDGDEAAEEDHSEDYFGAPVHHKILA